MIFLDYVMSAPAEAQGSLLDILNMLEQSFPDAEQRISHRMPTFFYNNHDIINVGAFKDHFAMWVDPPVLDILKKKYPMYKFTKVTIQFPYSEPFPHHVMGDICDLIRTYMDH